MPVNVVPALDDPGLALTARGSQRRQDLLDAALRLLVRDGHHAVTLRSVSLEANASHGSINYYFGSRGALMCALAETVCHRIATNLSEIIPTLEQCGDDPDRFASVLAQHSIRFMIDDRSLSIAITELTLGGARDDELRGVLVKWGKVDSRLTRNAFLKLGSADPDLDYAFVLNSLSGLVLAQLAIPRRDFEARILRPSLVRLIRSIAREKSPPAAAPRRRATAA